MIVFDPIDYKPLIPHHFSFHIVVVYSTRSLTHNILHMVVDEGASTCVMSLACWKTIGQPELYLFPTFLNAFDD
jgi:hypothetical protein